MSLPKSDAVKSVAKKIKKMPKWLMIVIALILVLAIAAGAFFVFRKGSTTNTGVQFREHTVTKGMIRQTVTGSGSIEPNDQYEITPLVKGEILSAPFEEGDILQEGDVMYVIDSSDQETSMKKAQNSLKQAQTSYSEALETYDDLSIESTISGTVTQVYLEEGDTASNNAKIMDIVNNNKLTLSIPFIDQDADYISVGQNATVNVEGAYYTLNGTVTYVASGSSINAEGVRVRTVEIEVTNPGALEEGDKATAIIGNVACNAAGTFEITETLTIYSKTSGEIIYQPYRVGDVVNVGDTVLKIDSKSADKQLENAELGLENAEISYENTIDQLENYTITAPISGTVIQKNSKAGDSIDSGNGQTSMAVIADMSRMTFDISIDELDIQLLEVGQKATITADAFEGQVFIGVVDYISVIGSTSNGVTSYPVTIALEEFGDLLPGMNVDATIVVAETVDSIIIPVEAVQRNNIVYVKDDGTTSEQPATDAPSGKPQGDNAQQNRPQGGNPFGGNAAGGNASGSNIPGGNAQNNAASGRPQNGAAPGGGNPAQQGPGSQNTSGQNSRGQNASGQNAPGPNVRGQNVPEGFKAVKVELGINNDSFIEILSGLKEGDIIYVPVAQRGNAQTMPSGFGGGGFGGGMSGGFGGGMSGGFGGGMRQQTGGFRR